MQITITTKGKTREEMASNIMKMLAHILEGEGDAVPGDFGAFSHGAYSIIDDPKQKQAEDED